MLYTLIGYVDRGRFVTEEGKPEDRDWVQSRQETFMDMPDILRGEDGVYYIAPEGDPAPDLIPFDTLEAAVTAAIILSD